VNVGGSVNFFDQSANSPTSWFWIFTNGSPSTSTVQNPANITYNTAGSFDVTLTVSNANGSDNITKTGYINVIGGTGVDDPETDKYIKVIPNPNTGEFVIEMEITKTQDMEIKLLNVIGQVIYEEKLSKYSGAYQKTIDVGKQAAGIYTLQLITEKGTMNKKIIVE